MKKLLITACICFSVFSGFSQVKVGNQEWMQKNLNIESTNGESLCLRDTSSMNSCKEFGRFYSWEDAKTACPDGWRLPSEEDITVLINNLDGVPNERRGKVIHASAVSSLNLKMGGIHIYQSGSDYFAAQGAMEVWLTASDTVWNNSDPKYSKYNGHKIIGLHFYSKTADSLIVEPTYINSASGRKAFCRCMKE